MAVAGKTKKIFDNRYEILAIVGRGSGSVVYHARHVNAPASEVALKVLVDQKDSSVNSDRLRKEALAMVSCRHKHVLRLDDFHSVGALCYLCLEYAPESDLRKYVAKLGGKLGASQAELFLLQCAEALGFIHKAGIIHRDMKPDNILVVNHREIRICDFGIALLPGEHSSLEELQAGVGTMSYMSPEILEGKEYDHRADIYALGLSVYEMVVGDHPFDHAPLMKQLEVREDLNIAPLRSMAPQIPEYLSKIIMKTLRYNPDERFQTAKDLVRSIEMKEIVEARNAIVLPSSPPAPAPSVMPAPAPLPPASAKPAAASAPAETPMRPAAAFAKKIADPFTSAVTEVIPRDTRIAVLQAAGIDPAAIAAEHGAAVIGSTAVKEAPPPPSEPPPAAPPPEPQPFEKPAFQRPVFKPAISASPLTAAQTVVEPMQPYEEFPEIFEEPAAEETSLVKEETPQLSFRERLKHQDSAAVPPAEEEPAAEAPEPDSPLRLRSSAAEPAAQPRSHRPRNRLRAYGLPIGLLVAALTIFAMKDLSAIKIMRRQAQQIIVPDSRVPSSRAGGVGYLPSFAPDSVLAFPELPGGVYSGTIAHLIAKEILPLTIISFPEFKTLAIMVGVEGWTPRPILIESPDSAVAPGTIRVASNGFILDFSAGPVTTTNIAGEITGSYKNVITGEAGVWKVKPVR